MSYFSPANEVTQMSENIAIHSLMHSIFRLIRTTCGEYYPERQNLSTEQMGRILEVYYPILLYS